jgi:hypothetical protein
VERLPKAPIQLAKPSLLQEPPFQLQSFIQLRDLEKEASHWLIQYRFLQHKHVELWHILHGRYKYLIRIMGMKEPRSGENLQYIKKERQYFRR